MKLFQQDEDIKKTEKKKTNNYNKQTVSNLNRTGNFNGFNPASINKTGALGGGKTKTQPKNQTNTNVNASNLAGVDYQQKRETPKQTKPQNDVYTSSTPRKEPEELKPAKSPETHNDVYTPHTDLRVENPVIDESKDSNDVLKEHREGVTEFRIKDVGDSYDKMISDSNKDGDLNLTSVMEYKDGQYNLINYDSQIQTLEAENDTYKQELSDLRLKSTTRKQGEVDMGEVISEANRMTELQTLIDDNNNALSELNRKKTYQTGVVGKYALEEAVANNDVDAIDSLFKADGSYNDTWLERRGRNIEKTFVDIANSAFSVAEICADVGGQAVADVWTKGAEALNNSGMISNEQFNDMVEAVKPLADFDATDESLWGTQLRNFSNQLAYDIQNGVDKSTIEGKITSFIGEGLDSTENFFVQYLLLGETGSLMAMSGLSGSQKYFQNLENGYDQYTAFTNAVATGIISFATEKIGMDNFVNRIKGTAGKGLMAQVWNAIAKGDSPLSIWWANAVSQSMAEGLEEIVEGTADYWLDSYYAYKFNGQPVEYNAGDIFYSALVGAESGLMMGMMPSSYMGIVNTKQQYNTLKNDVGALNRIRAEMVANGETTAEYAEQLRIIDENIAMGESALQSFDNLSQLGDAVSFPNEVGDNTLNDAQVNEVAGEMIRPNVESDINHQMEISKLQERVTATAQEVLNAKGIPMDVNKFMQLDSEARLQTMNNAEQITKAFPNAVVYFDTDMGNNNAYVKRNAVNGKPMIVVNPLGETSVVVSAIHEAIHTIEGTAEYNTMLDLIFPEGVNSDKYQKKYDELVEDRYSNDRFEGNELQKAKAKAEEVAKEVMTVTISEELMNDETATAFINHLAKYNTNIAYKLLYNLRQATGIFRDNSTLGKVEAELTKALSRQDLIYNEDGVAYSSKGSWNKQATKLFDAFDKGEKINYGEGGIPLTKTVKDENGRIVPQMPEWATKLGFPKRPFLLRNGDVLLSQYDDADSSTRPYLVANLNHTTQYKDAISREVMDHLDIFFEDPIAVFDTQDKNKVGDAFVVVLKATDTKGYPIMMVVEKGANYKNDWFKFNDTNDINRTGKDTTVSIATSIYGKNNYTKASIFFKYDTLRWTPNGMQRADVLSWIDDMQKDAKGHTYVDPSIQETLNLEKQQEILEEKTKLDIKDRGLNTFEKISSDEEFRSNNYLTSDEIDLALTTGYITVYSDENLDVGDKINFYSGKNSTSVPVTSLVFTSDGNGYYVPSEQQKKIVDANQKTRLPIKDDADKAIELTGIINDLEGTLRHTRNEEYDNAKKELKKIKKEQNALQSSFKSKLDRLFPERYHNQKFDRFENNYKRIRGAIDAEIKADKENKYKGKSNDEIIALAKELAQDMRNYFNDNSSKLRTEYVDNNGKKKSHIDLDKLNDVAIRKLALVDAIGSMIEPIKLTDTEKNDLLQEYYLRKIYGEEKDSPIPEGARKLKEGERPRLDILVGPAGAGKTASFAKGILEKYKSVDLDSDHMKAIYDPNFQMFNGISTPYAGATSDLFDNMVYNLLNEGEYNLLWQGTGKTASSMVNLIYQALGLGYEVHLHSAETFSDISFESAIDRGLRQRITPIDFMFGVDVNPASVYDLLKEMSFQYEDENGDIIIKGINSYEQVLRYGHNKFKPLEKGIGTFASGKTQEAVRGSVEQTGETERTSERSIPRNGYDRGGNSRGVIHLNNESQDSFSNDIQLSAGSKKALNNMLNSSNPDIVARAKELADKLTKAEKYEKIGLSPNTIWHNTGWIRKNDGKWRFQFYDGAEETFSKINDILDKFDGGTMADARDYDNMHIEDLVGKDNPILEMYPELKDLSIGFYFADDNNYGGYKKGVDIGDGIRILPSIAINLYPYKSQLSKWDKYEFNFKMSDRDEIANTFFHELQHAIQDIEGLESGSNPLYAGVDVIERKKSEGLNLYLESRQKLVESGLSSNEITKRLKQLDSSDYYEYKGAYLGLTEEQKKYLLDASLGKDNYVDPNVTDDEVYDEYRHNLGEEEANEEAERALHPEMRRDAPISEGSLVSAEAKRTIENLKDEIGSFKTKKEDTQKRFYSTIAPYLDTQLTPSNRKQLVSLAQECYNDSADTIAKALGITNVGQTENIGGYLNDEGKKLRELSWTNEFKTDDPEKVKLFTCLMGDLAFENQEAVICMRRLTRAEFKGHKIGEMGKDGGTYGREYGLKFKNLKTLESALKQSGITDYSIDRNNRILYVQDFGFDDNLPEKLNKLLKGGNYESSQKRGIYSYYLRREDRAGIYETRLASQGRGRNRSGSNLSPELQSLIEDAQRRVNDVIENGQNSPFLRREVRQQRFQENLDKSIVLNEQQKERVRQMSAKGEFTYVGQHDDPRVERARKRMERVGDDETYDDFMSNNTPNADSVIQGEILLAELAKNNDKRWENVASKLADDATIAGQFLQAYAILQRLTPEGQLMTIRRNMRRMQMELSNERGNKAPELEINPELEQNLRNAETPEEQERARDAIYKDLQKQIPKTWRDTLDAWRYLSMLFNPRTHIRNVAGNAIFAPMVDMKNALGTVLESAIANKLEYRTKAILNLTSEADRALIEAGKRAYQEHRQAIEKGRGQKYEHNSFSDKTELGKFLNKINDFNSNLLDAEDFVFSGDRFARTYAQFLKANGLTAETLTEEMQKKALAIAKLEAEKATYRDFNSVAKWLNQLRGSKHFGLRAMSYVTDAIMPYTTTPMNIVRRGIEYSPVGLVNSILDGFTRLKDGRITANQFIDELSAGLTGTGVALLGALLRSLGIFRTKDDDEKRKSSFDKENGEQDYAIDLSFLGVNGTYTLDWASPSIMPFAMGAETYEWLKGLDGNVDVFSAVADISAKLMDPVMETSMLSSMQDALKSYANGGGEWMGQILTSMASSYAQQMIPTIGGQLARTIDDTRRRTYPNSGTVDQTLKKIYNKIPWASKLNEPYINKQGQEEKTEDLGMGAVGRLILNTLSAGYYSSKDIDKYDEELYRLYDSTGSVDAFPSNSSNEFTYDKQKYEFSEKEYTQWHKTRWQTETEYVNSFIDSSDYKKMTDEDRVATIKDIRSYAQEVAKKEFLKARGITYKSKALSKAETALNSGVKLHTYYDYQNNAGDKQAEKIQYLEDSNLTQKQKEALYDLEGYKTSYEDAYKKAFDSKKQNSKKQNSTKKSTGNSKKSNSTKKSNEHSKTQNGVSNTGTRRNLAGKVATTPKPTVSQKYLKAYSNSFKYSNTKPSSGGRSMATCPHCGSKVPAGTNVCPSCGKRI